MTSSISLIVSPRHSWATVLAQCASVARDWGHGRSYHCLDWWAPQTHCHHVMCRTAYDGITCCTALDGNGCRPWTARSTSDEVRHIDVTSCCRTCTFDNKSPASCCNCRAAFSFPDVMNPVLRAAAHQSCRRTPETAG